MLREIGHLFRGSRMGHHKQYRVNLRVTSTRNNLVLSKAFVMVVESSDTQLRGVPRLCRDIMCSRGSDHHFPYLLHRCHAFRDRCSRLYQCHRHHRGRHRSSCTMAECITTCHRTFRLLKLLRVLDSSRRRISSCRGEARLHHSSGVIDIGPPLCFC
ncbi:uncharacterized protein LOC132311057 [Cornus florida]|uniref:uncharacterized protein LOC132311057 n=1 Tax=Cornus florida TaxID=4283 RepID=UPI00289CDD1A|nr:uncharacterized protein LOC132311057 [Cornus florida]